ncbi:MAG: hypothetical protein GKR99_01850 [Rhodobacteraceae bacterium]|nr:hypothetical protein [Paracoccaceae bacterium]
MAARQKPAHFVKCAKPGPQIAPFDDILGDRPDPGCQTARLVPIVAAHFGHHGSNFRTFGGHFYSLVLGQAGQADRSDVDQWDRVFDDDRNKSFGRAGLWANGIRLDPGQRQNRAVVARPISACNQRHFGKGHFGKGPVG